MKSLILFFVLYAGISSVYAAEQISHTEPVMTTVENTDFTTTTTAKSDSLINLPTSIEISVKFAATEKKPEPHSVDLVLSKSTLATLSNYGAQTVTWAYEQAKDFVHKAALFTAEATTRD